MAALSDDAVRKVFVELQAKYISNQQNIATIKGQLQAKQRERKMAELTRRELDSLGENTNTFKPIGKMFIQTPLSEMKDHFINSIKTCDENLGKLEKTQKYWERQASDAQGNLNDIIHGPRSM